MNKNVPEELEIDGLDEEAKHVLAYIDNEAIGTGRILSDGHIGRVAVLKKHRGLGIGKLMMQELIEWAEEANLAKTLVIISMACTRILFRSWV